jgi:hypothetical protein
MKAKPLTMRGCSDCSWLFNPTNVPSGKSFDGIVRKFELGRNKAFAGHGRATLPRDKKQ